MKRTTILMGILAAMLTLSLGAQSNGRADALFERARQKETVQGDLQGAISTYREILSKHRRDRAVAARAMLQMALCHEKLGQAEAKKLYEEIARNYSDQGGVVAQARSRLAALGGTATNALTIRQLTLNEDQQCYPFNVSEDGRLLGATEYSTGNMAVIDAATGGCKALTNWGQWNQQNGFVDQGVISRDGRWLASWHYGAANDGEIRIVGTDGKGERTVYVRRKGEGWKEWGSPTDWSPDGKRILAHMDHSSEFQQATAEIVTVDATTGAIQVLKTIGFRLRHGPKFLFSPDGKWIAWDQPDGAGSTETDLMVMPAGGGTETRIAASPGRDTLVAWTPAGELLFTSNRSGRNGLYLVKVNGGKQSGEPREVRADVPEIQPIGLTAKGTLFYAEQVPSGNTMFADIDLSTGKALSTPAPLVERFPNSTLAAAWSPDGRYFAVRRLTPDRQRTTFLIRDTRDGSTREISAAFLMHQRARLLWSADGRFLSTTGDASTGAGVFLVDVVTGAAKLQGKSGTYYEWTTDGRFLYRRGGPNNGHIIRDDAQTGESRAVYENGALVRTFSLSPDGKTLAFVAGGWSETEPSPLMLLDLATGNARKVGEGFFSHTPSHLTWTPDGSALLSNHGADRKAMGRNLTLIPNDGSAPKPVDLRLGSKSNIDNLVVHPNGKTISWTLSRTDRIHWAMDNILPTR